MKRLLTADIISNDRIAAGIFDMRLRAPFVAENAGAGQFVQLYMQDGAHILPRPISVCGADGGTGELRLVYKTVGWGTHWLAGLKPGESLRLLGPLGNGFKLCSAQEQAVVGGGVGLPPLLYVCRKLKEANPGCRLTVYAGFRSEPFLVEDFEALGARVLVATDDGSAGFRGNTAQMLESTGLTAKAVYACGPEPMLAAAVNVANACGAQVQVSLEERMACGFGACVGCVAKIKDSRAAEGWNYKEVCKHGPVFDGGEVVWHG